MAIGGMLNANPLATRSTSAVVKAGDLKLLTYNSGPLQDLILSARHRLQNLMVVSFYETEPTPPLNSLESVPSSSEDCFKGTRCDAKTEKGQHAFVEHETWFDKTENALLWLIGHPGCGKTITSLSLANHLEHRQKPPDRPATVLLYFCDDKVNRQKDAIGVLTGLILQILHRHRSMIRYVRKVHKYVKVLLTSRPVLGELHPSDAPPGCQLSIDENQPGYSEDLQTYIRHRVDDLSRRRDWAPDIKAFLLDALCSNANQTFLWIHTVIESLENTLLASIQDLRDIISTVPPDLEAIYMDFVTGISPNYQAVASKLLKLLLASERPLQLDEINISFTISSHHDNAEDVARACQTSIRHTLQGILGPFIRISESTVSLVHQSVKDFLLRDRYHGEKFPAMLSISEGEAALEMASACIRYLQLDDFSTDISASTDVESSSEVSGADCESPTTDLIGGLWDEEEQALGMGKLFRESGFADPETWQTLETKYKFYDYAALNWTKHFALCEASASSQLREAATALIDVENWNCYNWLQRYWADPSTHGDSNPADFHPIVAAAYFGLPETVVGLLESIDRTDPTLDRALFFASQQGHLRVVSALLQAGADPNAESRESQRALAAAAEHGHLGCVIALVTDDRTDLNGRGGKFGRTALSYACSNGHREIVKELLTRAECRVDQADYKGLTPFIHAVKGGYLSIARTLARRPDVDINHRDKEGRTALSWAAEYGMDEVVKCLLNMRRIDPNVADENRKSPLSWAAGNGRAETVDILMRNKRINKASIDKNKRGAISWACAGGHPNALRVLLKHECPGVDDRDVDGWTPLAWAVQQDRSDVVEALLATGKVDIEGRDDSGLTALFWAAGYGHLPVVRALLREGANPRAMNHAGKMLIEVASSLPNVRREILDELNRHIEEMAPTGSS
ncbi:hypothetical protein SAPIO_CDS4385 [Scedosporium apiospermum]|uniref:Nephrocystin 3-like N-terminal domain-containing protein n=1 Tax=Pseudallescheria apiosperma TaxID=563466 RepID=A0A084G8T6_PSEDA|nr:uncharacterized protein SAPIO_CDS4385 [Scedosporium apiospermum]KEZ43748.1 hypothetical protein SAPIO_CDS4385 [Scedosporium apiospermum]